MTITIDDPALDQALTARAARSGLSVEQYVIHALIKEMTEAHAPSAGVDAESARLERLDRALKAIAAAPVLDSRPMDELLGYNDAGMFD